MRNVLVGLVALTLSFVITIEALDYLDQVQKNFSPGLTPAPPPPESTPEPFPPIPRVVLPPGGPNLIPNPEIVVSQGPQASFVPAPELGQPIKAYRLAATGATGEHYVGLGVGSVRCGLFALELQAQPEGTPRLRLQLLNSASSGVIADIDLATERIVLSKLGNAAGTSGVVSSKGDWQQVRITTTLATGDARVVLQVMDRNGGSAFVPKGEVVLLRGIRLLRGQSPAGCPDEVARLGGPNLIPDPEAVVGQGPHASFAPAPELGRPKAYRLAATGGSGEHYVGLALANLQCGRFALELQAKPAGTPRLRVQLLDSASNGVVADIDMTRESIVLSKLGKVAGTNWDVSSQGDWQRASFTTTLGTGDARVLLQVIDRNGNSAFIPKGEAIMLREIRLLRGESPENCPTAGR